MQGTTKSDKTILDSVWNKVCLRYKTLYKKITLAKYNFFVKKNEISLYYRSVFSLPLFSTLRDHYSPFLPRVIFLFPPLLLFFCTHAQWFPNRRKKEEENGQIAQGALFSTVHAFSVVAQVGLP